MTVKKIFYRNLLTIENSEFFKWLHYVSLLSIDSVPQKSLGEEVNELTSSRLLKLEKDNQTLLKTVEELRGAASQDTVAKLSKVNQENQRLSQKVSNELCIEGFFSDWVRSKQLLFELFLLLNEARQRKISHNYVYPLNTSSCHYHLLTSKIRLVKILSCVLWCQGSRLTFVFARSTSAPK